MDDSPTTETLVVSKQKHNKENDTLQSRNFWWTLSSFELIQFWANIDHLKLKTQMH